MRQLCAILGISRGGYYQKRARLDQDDETELREQIEKIIVEFPGYGYRRVTHALHRAEQNVNHKRVRRIMREESLLCQLKRRWVPTTDSAHTLTIYPNLVKAHMLWGSTGRLRSGRRRPALQLLPTAQPRQSSQGVRDRVPRRASEGRGEGSKAGAASGSGDGRGGDLSGGGSSGGTPTTGCACGQVAGRGTGGRRHPATRL